MKKHLLSGAALRALALPMLTVGALALPVVAHAQETTSSIQGNVTRGGTAEGGVTVVVTHVPSGTRSTATTDMGGAFTLSGLRVGGPYTVEAGGTQVTDIQLTAGQAFTLPVELPAEAAADIVVTASRVVSARTISQGPVNVLTSAQIAQVASVNRDIRDLARRDPFATLDTSSTNGRNVSFAGQNPRFNRFTIDGVPITDGFGLNPDALPSRRGPVPLDAIEQFQTKVAPYDVRDGFFQGGIVNAVLKSGTNRFHGTAFFTYSSDGLTGQRTRDYILNPTGRVVQPRFKDRDFGAEISGPIIPDRLFFMVAAERVRASRPIAFGTVETNAGTAIPGLTDATFARVTGIAQSRYSYAAGGIATNNGDRDDRLVARLDANISDNQRASATYIYTKDSLLVPTNTATTGTTAGLGALSNYYIKPNEVNAGIFQLNSTWSSAFSTELRLFFKDYNSGQIPTLANAAQFQVCTAETSDRPTTASASTGTLATNCPNGTPSVYIGPGGPSQFNLLKTKTRGGSFQTRLSLNDHSVRMLFDYQDVRSFNLFLNNGNGAYYFDSIADFQAGVAQRLSYASTPTLDPKTAAASFRYQSYTFGIQDDWRVNDFLNISYGMRYDLFGGSSRPALNTAFTNRYGFSNTSYISGRGLFQPRFGFDFRPTQRLSFRGGGGIFGGGTPDVYVSNSFQNSGVLTQSVTVQQTDGLFYQVNGVNTALATGQSILNNVNISTVSPVAGALITGGSVAATSDTNSLDPAFKVPSQFRATLSADYRANLGPLGDGWRFGADFFYSKVRNQVLFTDLRSVPLPGGTTPDGRQRYTGAITPGGTGNDYYLTNTQLGRSYVAVVRFDKTFDFGVNVFGSYTWQDVKDQTPATSSTASSNYGNGAFYDPNRAAYGTSNDQVKWQFKYGIGFDRTFFGENHTRFNLFGETRAGSPFSYTVQDSASRSTVFGTTGTNTRYLFYVPTGPSDPLVTYSDIVGGNSATRDRVEAIINGSGLRGYRGQVSPRNAFRSKAFTKIDLHAEQEIPLPFGGKFTLFGDIENFTNLLNRNWGQQLRNNFPYYKNVVNVSCAATSGNSCTQYLYTTPRTDAQLADLLVTANGSSLYAIRLGVRVSF